MTATGAYETRFGTVVVAMLLIFEVFSGIFLWAMNPVGPHAETTFALFLTADLVSFAIMSYVYRILKEENRVGRTPVLAGFLSVLILIFAAVASV